MQVHEGVYLVLFAGESTSTTGYGTVHGAMEVLANFVEKKCIRINLLYFL